MIELVMTPLLWFVLIIIAAIIDELVGDPSFLLHPVRIIGKLIEILTLLLNRGKHLKFKGFLLVTISLVSVFFVINFFEVIIDRLGFPIYFIFNCWFCSTALSEKSLFLAGKKVKDDLNANDIIKARQDTAEIVGRRTKTLNKSELIRAVVETEAENAIDGIISPLFFMIMGIYANLLTPYLNPLVLAYLYKTVNTLDSMVGYPYEPYTDFGFFSAKLDDIVNWFPARLGSLLMILAGGLTGYDMKQALAVYENDRLKHTSPNAGNPEAAIAGILKIQLGGTNTYDGHVIEKPLIGKEIYPLKTQDIIDTMRIVIMAELLFFIFFAIIIFFVYVISHSINLI